MSIGSYWPISYTSEIDKSWAEKYSNFQHQRANIILYCQEVSWIYSQPNASPCHDWQIKNHKDEGTQNKQLEMLHNLCKSEWLKSLKIRNSGDSTDQTLFSQWSLKGWGFICQLSQGQMQNCLSFCCIWLHSTQMTEKRRDFVYLASQSLIRADLSNNTLWS